MAVNLKVTAGRPGSRVESLAVFSGAAALILLGVRGGKSLPGCLHNEESSPTQDSEEPVFKLIELKKAKIIIL